MNTLELRATISLASVFALRMFGLFMIMPVFSVYARTIPGGDNAVLVGVAVGIYGLTQAALYIFYGWLSDCIGRKPVIVSGLAIFAFGCAVAACANNIYWIIAGRALQGAGAISSAVLALIVDLTTESNRTKAMAIVGGSIGASFGVAIVVAPLLYTVIGMSGLFTAIGILSVLAIAVVLWIVPNPKLPPLHIKAHFNEVFHHCELLRMNFSVFALHATQSALFVVVPRILVGAGLPISSHWKIYTPVMVLAFMLMIPAIIIAEKRGRMKSMMLWSIIAILISPIVLSQVRHTAIAVATALLIYFTGFNILEVSQPSLVSRLALGTRKGAAMGIYNTAQALGFALGGVMGGWLLKLYSDTAVFYACFILVFSWLIIAIPMRIPLTVNSYSEVH
nr:MFS transporter [Candidatus Vallotia lariciata]